MGYGESRDKEKDDETSSIHSRASSRRLYRQGSLCSQLADPDADIPLHPMGGDLEDSMSNIRGMRQRTPSGKSIRSRTASRVEYHEDLKPSLRQGLTRNLLFMALIILIGNSFIFGYNIGVLNQPSNLIKDFYKQVYANRLGVPLSTSDEAAKSAPNITAPNNATAEEEEDYTITFLWSLTTAMFLPGGMVGAFCAGFLADKVGRKRAVLISHIPAFIGAVVSTVCVVAQSPELLMLGRLITGLNCGFATQLAPMYLAEITPYNLRGAFGTANQLFITIGIFLGSVFGLRELLGTPDLWPYLLLMNAIPAFVSLVALPFLPDSPRYLMILKNQRTAAEKSLRFLRNMVDVSADIEEMETEMTAKEAKDGQEIPAEDREEDDSYTMKQLLNTQELRMPLFVACMLQVIQQLSGINAVFFYSSSIYKESGVPEESVQYSVVGTNAVNVLMTLVAVPIMDVAGRRPLLLYPMILMVAILGLITAALQLQNTMPIMSYISIACVIAYVICFAIGLGPIPMMIGAELFRQGPRPRAMSLAGLTNWVFTLVVAISFELIQKAIKEYTFIIFLVLMIIFTIFVFFKVPETKNKTFEEIASVFQPGGTIEVEELVDDDVFDDKEFTPDDVEERVGLMHGRKARNGSVPSHTESAENVTLEFKKSKSDDKMSLTKSQEDVNVNV